MPFEQRNANLIINKAGGNAGADSKNYHLSLPSCWVHELGLDEQNRGLVMQFDGERIILQKQQKPDYASFLAEVQHKQHPYLLLHFYEDETLCTRICADQHTRQVAIENTVSNIWRTAFGVNDTPTWKDLESFLESRCVPKSRDGIRYYLEELGLDSYDPLSIIRKTEGRMAEDHHWIRIVEG